MHSPLITWSRYVYVAGLVLALVLFIPTAWFPFQLGKVSAFALCAALSILFFVWGGGMRTFLRAHGAYLALGVVLLPLVYFVSSYFSIDPSLALIGEALDTDTILFVVLAALAFILAFVHFRTLRTLKFFFAVCGVALAVAALFQYVSIIFGTPIPGVTDRSINLIGKWNDLGLLLGLLGLLILTYLELSQVSTRLRVLGTAALVILAALLAFINFMVVWALLLGGAIVVGLVSYLSVKSDPPSLSIVAGVVAGLCLVFGATFNSTLTSIFPVSSIEVRPAASTTFDLISRSYDGSVARFAVGMGPNTFARQWMLHKPTEVNQSQFWSLDFNVGFSTLSTALLSVGILGLVAWLLPLLLVLMGAVRAVRNRILGSDDRVVAIGVMLATLFMYAVLAFYVPSPNLILLAFALSGAAFGFLWRQGRAATDDIPLRRIDNILLVFLVALLVAVSIAAAIMGVRRLVSTIMIGQGQVALAAGNGIEALQRGGDAVRVEETPGSLRLLTDAAALRLSELARSESPTSALQAEFTSLTQESLTRGNRLIALAPNDYRSYLSVGAIYDLLTVLRVDGALASARSSYAKAAETHPTNPAIPLLQARLEAAVGDRATSEKHLERALTLKPNYTDAMLFVVQLAVANNDLSTAIRAASSAAASAPGVASIWFQLGLLYYAGGDTAQALLPLERAVQLLPEYANAKYFLGVSYYLEGRPAEAIALFEELERTNGEVEEVGVILANMRNGSDVFDGLTVEQPAREAPIAE